jgi:hypothetical protein
MADIVCKNTAIAKMQRNAFLSATDANGANPLASCSDAYNLDIAALLGTQTINLKEKPRGEYFKAKLAPTEMLAPSSVDA